jgi:hypothetical protein
MAQDWLVRFLMRSVPEPDNMNSNELPDGERLTELASRVGLSRARLRHWLQERSSFAWPITTRRELSQLYVHPLLAPAAADAREQRICRWKEARRLSLLCHDHGPIRRRVFALVRRQSVSRALHAYGTVSYNNRVQGTQRVVGKRCTNRTSVCLRLAPVRCHTEKGVHRQLAGVRVSAPRQLRRRPAHQHSWWPERAHTVARRTDDASIGERQRGAPRLQPLTFRTAPHRHIRLD